MLRDRINSKENTAAGMGPTLKISIIDKQDLGKVIDVLEPKDIYELAAIVTDDNWSPSVYNNGRRSIKEFIRTELIALDIDDGCSLLAAKEIFKDYKHIIATSKSHQKNKNGKVADRFRVVLFLNNAIITDKDFKETFKALHKKYNFIDEACKDASRFFFPCGEIVSIKETGKAVTSLKAPDKPEVKRVEAPEGERGELWKSTFKLLAEGAPEGTRHQALVKATGNMREQGYTFDEIVSKIDTMAEKTYPDGWGTPHINNADMATVERMFERDLKYSFQEKQEEPEPEYISAFDLVSEAVEYLSDKEGVKGEPTGIEGLDKLLGGGLRTGELSVLMAQAKTGKNTLLHDLLYRALKRNIAHGYASRELSPATEVIPNLFSIALGINAWEAKITEDLQKQFRDTAKDWQLFFAPGYGYFPIDEMEAWFKKLKGIGVNYFFFDHFHYALLKEDYEATSRLIKKLKSLTKELDIHITLIVQPRSLRDEETLSLSTLRGGAAIGQALDNLFILERVKNSPIPNISKLTLEVARHKLAKPGHLFLEYDPKTTRMTEVQKSLLSPKAMPDGSSIPKGYKASTAFNKPKMIFNEN